jgi:hypothetical protein
VGAEGDVPPAGGIFAGEAVGASAMERRRVVINPTDRPMLVFIEPEAQDYWLQRGESVELRAEVESPDDNFELQDNGQGITVWPSAGMGYIAVHVGDVLLGCGHQRPVGWGEAVDT